MNLGNWLLKLGAVCSAEPKDTTVEAYLEMLSEWKLTDSQWDELRKRAAIRHRFPGKLPTICELDDIRRELVQEAQYQAENERRRQMDTSEAVPCPPEIRERMDALFKQK